MTVLRINPHTGQSFAVYATARGYFLVTSHGSTWTKLRGPLPSFDDAAPAPHTPCIERKP